MKKILFMATTLALSPVIQAKVSYEDALASSADFYSHNNSISNTTRIKGMDPGELQEEVTTASAMELLYSGKTTSYKVPSTGFYVVHTSAGTSPIYVSSLTGSSSGASTTHSNNARGIKVSNGKLYVYDNQGRTFHITRVFRVN